MDKVISRRQRPPCVRIVGIYLRATWAIASLKETADANNIFIHSRVYGARVQ